MALQVTEKQLYAITSFVAKLENFVISGYGQIKNLSVLYNPQTPDKLYIKYDKSGVSSDDFSFQLQMIEVDENGTTLSVKEKLGDVFAISAFLSMCQTVNVEKLKDYLI